VALLRELHAAGHELYFLSNMPAPYADHLQSSNDFMDCFTDGVFSGRVGHNKPEQAIFEVAANALVRPRRTTCCFWTTTHPTCKRRRRWGGRRCSSPTRRRRGPCCMSGHWSAELR
jgi:hypothetical protein